MSTLFLVRSNFSIALMEPKDNVRMIKVNQIDPEGEDILLRIPNFVA